MRFVYLDNAASTRPAPEVLAESAAAADTLFANPSSVHGGGAAAARALEAAREDLARALTGSDGHAGEIVLTSGGTEANALAILGVAARQRRRHVVVTAIEHPSVLRNVRRLAEPGARGPGAPGSERSVARLDDGPFHEAQEITIVGVGKNGVVDPEEVVAAVRPDTALVCVMHVNNELGTIQPVEQVARGLWGRAHPPGGPVTRKPHLHVDAVQSFGHIGFRVGALGADSVAVSAHKIHGPKGVGALWLRTRATLAALWDGGRQEWGLRSGTENLPGAVGFACAARLAVTALAGGEQARLGALRDRFEGEALRAIPGLRPTVAEGGAEIARVGRDGRGGRAPLDVDSNEDPLGEDPSGEGPPRAMPPRAPHISSLALPGLPAEPLLHALEARGILVSAGSACASRLRGPSHVLEAVGLDARTAVLRFSLSRQTTEADLDAAIAALRSAVAEVQGGNQRAARRR
jgi:cysteine desulfurase